MTLKRLATLMGVLALVAIIAALAVSTAFAQTPTPQSPDLKNQKAPLRHFGRLGFGFGMGSNGSFATFDAMAEALGLTPTQLFEQLHSGKTLSEIAQEQNVDLQAVQDAAKAVQVQAARDRINQALADGTLTQEQADRLLEGLDQGMLGKGRGFGFGHGMQDGMRDKMRDGMRGRMPKLAPSTPQPSGTAS